MNLSEQFRQQWKEFEQWLVAPRAATQRRREEIFIDIENEWRNTPPRSRVRREDLEAEKRARVHDLEEELVVLARLEWQKRLEDAGLRDEDWTNQSFAETLAVERALANGLDREGMAIMENVAYRDAQPRSDNTLHPMPPQPSATPRSSGISATYSFVNPTTLGVEERDSYERASSSEASFSFDVITSGDGNMDAVTDASAAHNMWEGSSPAYSSLDPHLQAETPAYIRWSQEAARSQGTSQSSRTTSHSSKSPSQSSQPSSPEQPPYRPVPDYPNLHPYPAKQSAHQPQPHVPPPGAPDPEPPERAMDIRSTKVRTGHRYIGPKLSDPDEHAEEAAEFENFKMETRKAKIYEFHNEAARADISLAVEIHTMQKTGGGPNTKEEEVRIKEQERRMLEEHEKRMLELRQTKEKERKAIVEDERQKRRAEIRRREERKRKKRQEAAQPAKMSGLEALTDSQGLPFDIERISRWAAQQEAQAKLHENTNSKTAAFNSHDQLESTRARSQEVRHSQLKESRTHAPATVTSKNMFSSNAGVVSNNRSTQLNNGKSSGQMQGRDSHVQAPGKVAEQTSSSAPGTSKHARSQSHQGRPQTHEYWVPGAAESNSASSSSSSSSSNRRSQPSTSESSAKAVGVEALITTDQTRTASSGPKHNLPGPSRKQPPRAIEIETQTQGASSSKLTLDQMAASSSSKASQKPDNQEFWLPTVAPKAKFKPSLNTQTVSEQPKVPLDHREFWVPPAESKTSHDAVHLRNVSDPLSVSRSPQIEKATSNPEPQLVQSSNETKRLRRMSDPVSPNPRSRVERGTNDENRLDFAAKRVKNLKTETSTKVDKPTKAKRVMVEEISDDEEPGRRKGKGHDRDNPSDSNVIIEPKPSVPSTTFAQIFQYGAEARKDTRTNPPSYSIPRTENLSIAASAMPRTDPSGKIWYPGEPNEEQPKAAPLDWDALQREPKTSKAKHVRWTPSVLAGGSPNLQMSFVDPFQLSNESAPGSPTTAKRGGLRSRANSVGQTNWDFVGLGSVEGADKGKGKERAAPPDVTDELAWYAKEAMESLIQMRSKPASAV